MRVANLQPPHPFDAYALSTKFCDRICVALRLFDTGRDMKDYSAINSTRLGIQPTLMRLW